MKIKIIHLSFFLLLKAVSFSVFAQNTSPSTSDTWINEIHYDNAGKDVDEAVEIVLKNAANYTLSDFKLLLINGAGNSQATHFYDSITLDQCIKGDKVGDFTIYHCKFDQIQNGGKEADGMALVYQHSNLIQFLSYEGTITGKFGIVKNLVSTDIDVQETGRTPIGSSLQLVHKCQAGKIVGDGMKYGDYVWKANLPETFGKRNQDASNACSAEQTLPVSLLFFSAKTLSNNIVLTWETASEKNNDFFTIARSTDAKNFIKIARIDGQGNSYFPTRYNYIDTFNDEKIVYYQLSQTDFDGTQKELKILSVLPKQIQETAFDFFTKNNYLHIRIHNFETPGKLFLSDMQGKIVKKTEINQVQNWLDCSNLKSGLYLVKVVFQQKTFTQKIVLD